MIPLTHTLIQHTLSLSLSHAAKNTSMDSIKDTPAQSADVQEVTVEADSHCGQRSPDSGALLVTMETRSPQALESHTHESHKIHSAEEGVTNGMNRLDRNHNHHAAPPPIPQKRGVGKMASLPPTAVSRMLREGRTSLPASSLTRDLQNVSPWLVYTSNKILCCILLSLSTRAKVCRVWISTISWARVHPVHDRQTCQVGTPVSSVVINSLFCCVCHVSWFLVSNNTGKSVCVHSIHELHCVFLSCGLECTSGSPYAMWCLCMHHSPWGSRN